MKTKPEEVAAISGSLASPLRSARYKIWPIITKDLSEDVWLSYLRLLVDFIAQYLTLCFAV